MKRITVNSLFALAASLVLGPAANAAGFIFVDPVGGLAPAMMPPVRPPIVRPPIVRPPVTRPPVTRPPVRPILHGSVSAGLHLQSESIKVDVNDQVAKTYICQTFVNDTDRNLAGTYMFPLPDDTTFSSFSLHIDGKPVEGKILEANEARQQYEEIVRRMVDPGLLEYADYKTVRARIFPIPAHGAKKVELEYTQVLRAENGMIKYRFPLKTEGQSSPVDEIKVDVKLASKQGLRTIWSPSHTISANRPDDHHAKVALLSKNSVPDKDFVLYYSVSDKELAANLLTHKDSGEDGYFLLTLTPPVQSKVVLGKDIVIVADTSGSMAGEKMEQNKKALKYVVNALNANDHFNIVQFNTDVEKFRSQLLAATPENKKAALAFIDELEARGGTNIGDALRTGTNMLNQPSERPAYLVFMTDGEPTVGETDVAKLLKIPTSTRDIRVFDFGVGYDINTKLLNKLAEQHHGTAQYVEPDEDIEVAMSGFYQKIKSPVLSNINLAYEGIQVKDVYPRNVKDIFAGSQVLLIGKYKNAGKAAVRLTGKINGEARAYSFPLTFASEETGHTYLPRLWAMRRIGYLTDIAQDNNNNREIVDEIIALSKKYGIISAYTSFLVTDPSEDRRVVNNRPIPAPMPMMSRALPRTRLDSSVAAAPMSRAAAESESLGWASGSLTSREGRKLESARWHASPKAAFIRGAEGFSTGHVAADKDFRYGGSAGGGGGRDLNDLVRGNLIAAQTTGRSAVARSKALNEFKSTMVVADKDSNEESGIKTVEGKTFYLRDGFWTDSSFEPGKSPKPELISFGSQKYFDLIRSTPGISKYLAVGKQVIFLHKGHCYKIAVNSTTTG